MPFINVKVSSQVTKANEVAIKSDLGKIIEILPGKTEKWLMVNIEDNCRMYFAGNNQLPMTFIEVKIVGKCDREHYVKMTEVLCKMMGDRLGISPENVYIEYQSTDNWGWNNSNF
ncbi:MAG: phenylpyruvate tautomerase MIF-related protein [Oscillospiraceae bacterium]